MGLGGRSHAQAFLSQKRHGTQFTVDWVDPRAGLDGCGKGRPPLAFDLGPFKPVVSSCTD